jgi:hypothetical protein
MQAFPALRNSQVHGAKIFFGGGEEYYPPSRNDKTVGESTLPLGL